MFGFDGLRWRLVVFGWVCRQVCIVSQCHCCFFFGKCCIFLYVLMIIGGYDTFWFLFWFADVSGGVLDVRIYGGF